MKIKWIFFDVGSTLVDETEAYNHRAREMLLGSDISFEEFDKVRIKLACEGLDGNSAAISYFGLCKTPWHSEDELPYPDAAYCLAYLKNKGYKLGIIANQEEGLKNRLDAWDMLRYFDLIISSAETGCAKPDERIFLLALGSAECDANESIMVGDRLDNDIIPAKAVGMKTVWIKNNTAKYQDFSLGENTADFQINSLTELLDVL